MHDDRLIAALNKYYRPLTKQDYYDKMDIPATQNAVLVANFPKEVEAWIWETPRNKKKFFQVIT